MATENINCAGCGKTIPITLSKYQNQSDVRTTCSHCGKVNYCEQRLFKIRTISITRPHYNTDSMKV